MKKTSAGILPLVALLLLAACNNNNEEIHAGPARDTTAAIADTSGESSDAAPDSAALSKAWADYMTPGPMHKWMAAQEGKWDAELVSWMKPGGPPSPPSRVKVEFKMILNGLYQKSEYKGDVQGMQFEGTGLMAYDNARKKFMSTWVDVWGSGMLQLEGDYDESSRTLTLNGPATNPLTGKQSNFRQLLKLVDEKNMVMEMYGSHGKGEFKMLEIRLAKK